MAGIVVIRAPQGGVEALRRLVSHLPSSPPAITVVQHRNQIIKEGWTHPHLTPGRPNDLPDDWSALGPATAPQHHPQAATLWRVWR